MLARRPAYTLRPWRDEIARPARATQGPCARVLGCAKRYLLATLVSSRLIKPEPWTGMPHTCSDRAGAAGLPSLLNEDAARIC